MLLNETVQEKLAPLSSCNYLLEGFRAVGNRIQRARLLHPNHRSMNLSVHGQRQMIVCYSYFVSSISRLEPEARITKSQEGNLIF